MSRGSSNQRSDGFIWFAAQDWWYHNQAHSDFQLMKEVARTPGPRGQQHWPPFPRRSRHNATSNGYCEGAKHREAGSAAIAGQPWMPRHRLRSCALLRRPVGARINAWLIRQQVRAVAEVLGLGREPTIGMTIPTAWPVARRMRCSALLYNRSDLLSAFPEADNSWVRSLEEQLLRYSHRVLCES